eukprot:3932372-Rhodomonas_salina.4
MASCGSRRERGASERGRARQRGRGRGGRDEKEAERRQQASCLRGQPCEGDLLTTAGGVLVPGIAYHTRSAIRWSEGEALAAAGRMLGACVGASR